MSVERWEREGEFLIGYEWDGYTVTRGIFQPRAAATLELNKELRKTTLSDGPVGRWALSMNDIDRRALARLFPDINSPDAELRTKAWKRFMASPLSEPYKVRDKV